MRTLYLLRHAKSSWSDPNLTDRERPLSSRGRGAAMRLAQHVRSERVRPARVLCSPARRARDTFELLEPAWDIDVDLQVDDGLYGASARELLDRLHSVDPDLASVMIVGHNPGLHDLTLELAGNGDEDAIAQLRSKFPTGALATLDIGHAGWGGLVAGDAYLTSLIVPRSLP